MSDDIFTTEVSRRHEQMIQELESIDVDSLKSEGLKLTFGGKTFKFTDLEVIDDSDMENRIRSEFKEKLNTQQQKIREKINTKINQLLVMHHQKQQELDRKEAQMKRKYSEAAMMPDVTEAHMAKGLSVVKGGSNNELVWVYRAVYNPRFLIYYEGNNYSDRSKKRKPLPARLVNRMRKDMLVMIKTKDKQILSIATRKLQTTGRSLEPFPHYHQQSIQDCWGNWKKPNRWDTPDDIIRIAKEAEAILETINHGSLAEHNPTGLPRMTTLIKAAEKMEDVVEPDTVERDGGSNTEDDVWLTR